MGIKSAVRSRERDGDAYMRVNKRYDGAGDVSRCTWVGVVYN